MMIKSKFEFHSVGQGLFYSGIINNGDPKNSFAFVYDCGSMSKQEYLHQEIDTFKKSLKTYNKGNIDLLVISHFHNDHVNGIPYLLKDKTIKVNTVILQNLSEMQRLENYICYQNQTSNYDQELTSLILDPTQFFLKKGAERIVLVSNDDNNTEFNNSNVDEGPHDDIRNDTISIQISEEYIVKKCNKTIYTKNNVKCKNKLWEFCFLCDVQTNVAIHDRIKSYLARNNCDIKDLISNMNKINELIKELKEYKPKLQFNESSMILLHYPLHSFDRYSLCSEEGKQFSFYCNQGDYKRRCGFSQRYFDHSCCEHCGMFCSHYYYYDKSPVTILTGDVVLNNNICDIIEQDVNNNISVIFQVPHHGAKNNSAKFIDFIDQNSDICSIIPCGYMYNHPSDSVYGKLCKPYIVDIRYGYRYIIMKC